MSDFIHIEEILRLILARLPVATVAEMQLVSREWRRVIHSPSFARELYDGEQPHHQAVLIVTSTEIRAMYVTYLGQGNDNVVRNVRACIREFPTIRFPVTTLIGSCEGLVCLTDSCHQLFVINPRTLRVRQIMPEEEDNLRAWNYGFGWKLRDTMRCHIVLRLVDGGFKCVKIFDLTTNRWTRRDFNWACKNWRCKVDCEASSAFANGEFLWLGTVTAAAGHSFPSVIIFDAAQETFRHLPLLPEMIGFALRIGNIGDNFIGIWGRDADLTCFWRLNLTIGAFTPVNIEAYPSGIHFQPLCFPGGGRIVILQQHRHLDLYNHPKQSRNQLHVQTNIPWMLNHFTVEEFCMAIAFSPTLISPGELEDGAHADRSAYNDRHRGKAPYNDRDAEQRLREASALAATPRDRRSRPTNGETVQQSTEGNHDRGAGHGNNTRGRPLFQDKRDEPEQHRKEDR